MPSHLEIAMQVIADQRAAINALEANIANLKGHLVALEGAIVEKFGAHGVLVCQYSDPSRPDPERRKAATAAIAYEKARVGTPQEHQVFHLFDALETRRVAKALPSPDTGPTIEVTPSGAA